MGRLLQVCACSSRSRKWVTTPPFSVHAAESEKRAGNALIVEFIEELSERIRQGRDLCHTLRRAFRALAGTVIEGYKPARFHAACRGAFLKLTLPQHDKGRSDGDRAYVFDHQARR